MPRVANDAPWPKKATPHETGPPVSKRIVAMPAPVRRLSGQSGPAFKAAARAATIPIPRPIPKKTTKRRGDGRSFSTQHIVEDYLGLCRDPLSDLQRWLEEDKKKPCIPRASQQVHHARHAAIANAQEFLRDTLREVSGRVRANDNGRGHNSHVSDRSRTGASEPGQLQQVQGSRNLVVPASGTSLSGELAAAKSYYASRIAAARQTMSQAQLTSAIRAIHDEQTLAQRAIIQRCDGYFQGSSENSRSEVSERPSNQQPVLRYSGLGKS